MAQTQRRAERSFFWQGTLIVLPVVVLAAIGGFSLRQDRLLAQHEAAERAQTMADGLAPIIWAELLRTNASAQDFGFKTDAGGELIYPQPYALLPVPQVLDLHELSGEQAQLWRWARRAESRDPGREEAITAYRKFLDLGPPAPFRGLAFYSLGVLLENEHPPEAAVLNFLAVQQEKPAPMGESGLPLRPLAELKLLQLRAQLTGKLVGAVTVESVCSNAVSEPTAISPEILRVAADRATNSQEKTIVQKWRQRWDEEEVSRALYRAARNRLRVSDTPADSDEASITVPARHEEIFWFTSPVPWKRVITHKPGAGSPAADTPQVEAEGSDWLAIPTEPRGSTAWFHCLGESEVGVRVSTAVNSASHLPEYFGIGFEVAGRKLTWSVPDLRVWHEVNYFGRRGGGQKKELLDKAASTLLASASPREPGGEQLKVNIYLTSQAALFKRQYARTFWFGTLVAAAAVAALCGFTAAYRAFHRQVRLSEMKSNFVSSVSHELRAPIASVRLMAESLERGTISEPLRQQEYFRFIVQECRRLSSLIENVLDFSRIEQGRKEYEFEPTDILALLGQTVKLMEPYAAERQVGLALADSDCQASGAQDQIAVDGKAIQQALINLIDNAIKHSPRGQTVKIGTEKVMVADGSKGAEPSGTGAGPETARQAFLDLWVEDHGEGIPPAEHEKIFERFYRRGSELRRETSGVGIGLSIVKHIVEAHKGRVLVRSDVGQGSRFRIRLPIGPKGKEGAG